MPKAEVEKKRVVPGKIWFLTWNNYDLSEVETFIGRVREIAKRYVGQEEIGENGTPHIQMKMELLKKVRPIEYFKTKNVHWEKSRTWDGHEYCGKEATRRPDGRRWVLGLRPALKVPEIYGWQLKILDIIKEEPDERSIYWFWESDGCVGKSSLCKYLVAKHSALITGGKASDMMCALALMDAKEEVMPTVIVVDVPRSIEHISYNGFEQIKNGCFFSGKYESRAVLMNSPHFIVFANVEPDYTKMSSDRWKVFNIKDMM